MRKFPICSLIAQPDGFNDNNSNASYKIYKYNKKAVGKEIDLEEKLEVEEGIRDNNIKDTLSNLDDN